MSVSVAPRSMKNIRLFALIPLLVALLFATFSGVSEPSSVAATSGHTLFYSPFRGPNKVAKFSGSTDTATWSSGADLSGNAQAVAANGTHVFWSYGSKVFRQEITADAGSTATEFFNVNWYSNVPTALPDIKALVIDAPFIYILTHRSLDGGSVFRADLATGIRDTSWTYATGGLPCSGMAADGASSGSVYISCAFSDKIIRLSKDATAGQPTTVVSPWLSNNEIASGNSFITSLVSDETYLYWRTTAGTIRRALMQATSPGSSTTVVAALPTDEVISGLAMYEGTIYIGSSFGRSDQFIVFSAIPNAVTPATPTPFATIGSGGLRGLAVRTIPVPAATPTISSQPSDASKTVGDSASFTVSASRTDSGTLSYQWKKGGVDISGATSATYSISPVALTDAGTYSVVVTNTLGSATATVTSLAVQLTVSSAPAPITAPTTVAPAQTTVAPAQTTVAPAQTTVAPAQTTAPTTVAPTGASSGTTVPPSLVTPSNQTQFTSSAGSGKALVNGSPATVVIQQIDIPAADKEPAQRSATEVRQLQGAATQLVSSLNALLPAGATAPVVVVNTDTGAVINGLVTNVPVPIEDVTVVKVANQSVLVAGVNSNGTKVAPIGASNGPEIDPGGQVAGIAYGLTPGEKGEFIVMSTPILLGTFAVRTDGTFRQQATLPSGLPVGSHTLVVATPRIVVSFGFTVTAAAPVVATQLPATGSSNSSTLASTALASLVFGLILVVFVRRRRL